MSLFYLVSLFWFIVSVQARLSPRADLPVSGWAQGIQCVSDASSRLLNLSVTVSTVTVNGCTTFCGSYGFPYAGLENGNECWCGYTLNTTVAGRTLPASSCSSACGGDTTNNCGGPYAIRLFNYTETYAGFPAGWSLANYCVTDPGNSRLLAFATTNSSLTPAGCATYCDSQSYVYAGLEYGNQCWCGNTLNTAGGAGQNSTTGCTSPCSGDNTKNCGGGYLIRLYQKSSTTQSSSSNIPSTSATSTQSSSVISSTSSVISSRTSSASSSAFTSSTGTSSSFSSTTTTPSTSVVPSSSTVSSSTSSATATASMIPIVDLGYSVYQGTWNSTFNMSSFLSVRYAATPQRWRPPQPPVGTSAIQDATHEPTQCLQANMGQSLTNPYRSPAYMANRTDIPRKRDTAPFGEDCLYLNLFTPAPPNNNGNGLNITGPLKPVMVYIHGGGLVSGGSNPWPSMSDMVLQSYGQVVGVQMQYRLGLWGFLPGQRVKDDGVLNIGLLDQQFALQWIQKNIAQFGGDPNQVTIWGESSGAGCVMHQTIANGGNTQPPLFRSIMTSSVVHPPTYNYNDIGPETLLNMVMKTAGCTTMSCLRSASVDTLENTNQAVENAGYYHASIFAPVIDGSLIVDRPSVLLAQGKVNGGVAYVVQNQGEGGSYYVPKGVSFYNYTAEQLPFFTAAQVQQVVDFYGPLYPSDDLRQNAMVGDWTFTCPSYYLADGFKNKVIYKGRFRVGLAKHADDLYYEFPRITNAQGIQQYNADPFRQSFSQAFISVAMYQNPNTKIKPTTITPSWATWSWNNPVEMSFNKTASGAPNITSDYTESQILYRCSFWRNMTQYTWQ